MRRAAAVVLALCVASGAAAQEHGPLASSLESPYAPAVRRHYYQLLQKRPWRAFGQELLFPGAGNHYVGLDVPAALTLALSCVGAGLMVAGAVRDRDALLYTGVGTFVGARLYGAVSAPIHAALLNAAFRRQFAITD